MHSSSVGNLKMHIKEKFCFCPNQRILCQLPVSINSDKVDGYITGQLGLTPKYADIYLY